MLRELPPWEDSPANKRNLLPSLSVSTRCLLLLNHYMHIYHIYFFFKFLLRLCVFWASPTYCQGEKGSPRKSLFGGGRHILEVI